MFGKIDFMSRSFFLAALLLSARPGTAADDLERTHDITAEDYFTLAVVTDSVASPDGRFVAYSEERWEPPAEKRNTDLWVAEVATKSVRRLTFDRASDESPRWSADSRFIYFSSNPQRGDEKDPPFNGKTQVWRVSVDGGEPFPITRVKDGVGLFDLSGDGTTLYYTAANEVVADEWKDLREKHKDLSYGHGVVKFSQVWKLDLTSWRAEKLIDEKRVARAMAVSPSGRHIAMVTTPDDELISNEGWSRVDVYDTATKAIATLTGETWRNNHPTPYGWLDSVRWSGDGKALAFTVSYDGYPPRIYVAEWTGDEASVRELDRPDRVTVVGGTMRWRGPSRDLCFIAEERAKARVWCIAEVRTGKQGSARPLSDADGVVHSCSFPASGDPLVLVMGRTTHMPDIYVVDGKGGHMRITNTNPQVDTWKLPQISRVAWKGAGGDDVEGVLELPANAESGTRLPLIVEIHGGPTAATLCELRYSIYGRVLLPAKGYAVLSPNYRGSTGYGDKFMTDLIGRENNIEVTDILTGVDAMIERGIADPERLGVMGWSNGGFLTNCLITHTDRFKAASSGAGVLDMVIQWGTEDTPGHVINYMQGFPWSKPEDYRLSSPLYRLDKVRTPTLIHVGGDDARVPPAHSRALYRALRHYLNVPTELVVYPGEGHGLTTYKNRQAKLDWDLAWFDRYLMNKSTELPAQPATN